MADTSVIFNIIGKDNASSVFDKIGGALGRIGERAAGFVTGSLAVNGLSTAFDFAKDAVFGFNATLQNSQIAFTTMLGSGQKAQSFLNDLQSFAKSTPFEFGDLVKNAQNMMGMGIAAKDVIPDLRALGDSVASIGGSADQVNQVTLAFDQMSAKGTLDMGNMNQLIQGGVPNALKILADSYKVTTGQMIGMISTGKVQSADALPKLINGLEHGTKSVAALGGMMDKQSQTFTGALSNISDGLQQAIAGAFRPFFSIASEGAQKLGTFFSSDTFSKFGDKVSAALTKVIDVGKYFVGFFTGDGSDAIDGFSKNAFNKVDSVASAVYQGFQAVRAILGNLVQFVTGTVVPVGKDLLKTFGPLLAEAFGAGLMVVRELSTVLRPLGIVLKEVFGYVAEHRTVFQAIAVSILTIVAAQKAWTTAISIWTGVTKLATAAQVALDIAMDANPIGLIVLAIFALVAAFVYLWTHSKAFRDFWIGLWGDIWGFLKAVGAWFAGPFADFFVNGYNLLKLGTEVIVNWVHDKWSGFINFFTSMPDKIASIGSKLWNGLTAPYRAAINFIARGWNSLRFGVPRIDTHIPGIGVVGGGTYSTPQIPYLASGGTVDSGGLAIVGERGPELVSLPAGATVHPNGSSPRGGRTTVTFAGNTDSAFATFFMRLQREGLIQIT